MIHQSILSLSRILNFRAAFSLIAIAMLAAHTSSYVSAACINVGANTYECSGNTVGWDVIGTTGNDIFRFLAGATGQIYLHSGGGFDRLDFSLLGFDLTLNINAGAGLTEVYTDPGDPGIYLYLGYEGFGAVEIIGGSGNDTITGGTGDDTLTGGGGNDSIDGGTGSDVIDGGDGDDMIDGGDGDDLINGGDGDDEILDEAGDNIINGGAGSDMILSGTGNDMVSGGSDSDFILDLSGNDTLSGDDGDDIIIDLSGNDTINGGSGSDMLIGGGGSDTINGGDGDDIISGDFFNDYIDEDTLDEFDIIFGSGGDDIINGGSGSDVIMGDVGNDTINGGADSDMIDGGSGSGDTQTDSPTDCALDLVINVESSSCVKPAPAPAALPTGDICITNGTRVSLDGGMLLVFSDFRDTPNGMIITQIPLRSLIAPSDEQKASGAPVWVGYQDSEYADGWATAVYWHNNHYGFVIYKDGGQTIYDDTGAICGWF